MADQLRQVGVEAIVKQIETAQYFPMLTRREFQIGANLTASGIDDPDGYFFENYKCGASRNYTDYCDEAVDKLIDVQSAELDQTDGMEAQGGSEGWPLPEGARGPFDGLVEAPEFVEESPGAGLGCHVENLDDTWASVDRVDSPSSRGVIGTMGS